MTGGHRALRLLERTAGVLVGLVLALLLLVTLTLYALRFPAVQARALGLVNGTLGDLFQGKIVIERLGVLTLGGVTHVDAKVLDAQGRTVIAARDATVELALPSLLWQLVAERPHVLSIPIDAVDVAHVHVRLIDDGQGAPTLAGAFAPKTPSPSPSEGGGTRVLLPKIRVRHAWIDGRLGGGPALDAELDRLEGDLASLPEKLELAARVGLRARALPGGVDPDGKVSARLRLPSAKTAKLYVKGEFSGKLAKADARARFELDGDRLDGTLDAERIGSRTFQAFLPALKPRAPLALKAEVTGTLPELRFAAKIQGAGSVTIQGRVRAEDTTAIDAKVETQMLDLQGLFRDAPRTDIGLDAVLEARIDERSRTTAKYRASTRTLRVTDRALPPLALAGELTVSESSAIGGQGELDIAEPGAAAKVQYTLVNVGAPDGLVEASARVLVGNPKRFADLFSGRGDLAVAARVKPGAATFEAQLNGKLLAIRSAEAAAERVDFNARASGGFEAPELEGRVTATGLAVAGRRFTRVQLRAQGSPSALALTGAIDGQKPDRVRFSTSLTTQPNIVLNDSRLAVEDRQPLTLAIEIQRVALLARGVRVDGLALHGAGEARGALVFDDRPTRIDFSSQGLEVGRILAALGVDPGARIGKADLDVHYAEPQRGRAVGSVSGSIDGLGVDSVQGGTVRVDLAIANRTATGALEAAVEGGQVRVLANEITIPEQPWTAATAERVRGTLSVSGQLDLKRLEPVLTRLFPVGTAGGRIEFDLALDQARTGAKGPRLFGRLNATELRLSERRAAEHPIDTAEEARRTEPWSVEGLGVRAELELDVRRGLARLDGELNDRKGVLLSAQAHAKPAPANDLRTLLARDLERVPIYVRVATPPRALKDLPEMVQPKGIHGVLAFDAELEGTLADPRLRADANLSCLGTAEGKRTIDLAVNAEYARRSGRVAANAVSAKRSIGELTARWDGDLAALGGADPARPSPVQGDVIVKLERFPLELVPALAGQQVKGPLSGEVRLERFGRDAHLSAKLATDTIVVGTVGVQKLDVQLDTRGGELVGKLEIGGNRGSARAEVRAPMSWADRVTPSFERRVEGKLIAENFRIETLAPLVAAQVSELEGRLNANVQARIADGEPLVEGKISLDRGVAQIPAIGQRFSDIQARASIGRGQVRLERLTARGISGKLSAEGSAKLDGLSLTSAEARLRIDKDDKIPVTIEGSAIGDAWGKVDVRVNVNARERETRVRVDVPEFQLEMPDTNPAALQDLDAAETVRIGTRLPDGDFVTLPVQPLEDEEPSGDPSRMRVEVNLGNKVWMRKGEQVEVQLGGNLLVEQTADTKITGKIELRGGTLDVQGKRFEIERGTVTFTGGDPSNPTITAGARWDSPEGYSVTAEYSGTAQQGKLTLRSEPPLSDNEILSLLMFGTPDGTFGSGSGGTAETGIGLAGGTVAKGLNRVLSSITDLDVSARVDTSTGSSRPEIVVQLSPRLTARVTVAVGEPPPGQSPDRTFLRVDFRLKRAWSLSTMVGDRGASALDLIWRKRY
jgi:translocation and assembly module TamB